MSREAKRGCPLAVWLLIGTSALGLWGCDSCDDLSDVLDQEPDNTNLASAEALDWDDHSSAELSEPSFILRVCGKHFPLGSTARAEIEEAVDYFNSVAGADVSITLKSVDHRSKAELFADDLEGSYMDYVDNDEEGVFPCHSDGSTACSDNGEDGWVMNLCRYRESGGWGGSGDTKYFVISVNSHCKDHYNDSTADDYPKAENIAHEIGHAFGMKHSGYWPEGQELISTMQGGLSLLSAYDYGFLRHFHPHASFADEYVNFVASPVIRLPSSSSDAGHSNSSFEEINPDELYLDGGGVYRDCDTGDEPEFGAAWFNRGNLASDDTLYFINSISAEFAAGGDTPMTLHQWRAAGMTAESQDHWQGTVSLEEDALEGVRFGYEYHLVFTADAWAIHDERDEGDNLYRKSLVFREAREDCGDPYLVVAPGDWLKKDLARLDLGQLD